MKLHRFLWPSPNATHHLFIFGILAAFASIWPLSETAQAAAYTFTNIADTSGIFAHTDQNYGGSPGLSTSMSINNSGSVVFSSDLDGGGNGIFVGNGLAITTIARSSDPCFQQCVRRIHQFDRHGSV